ncbi:MAG: single-stranded-DNA-specific exonuclease RecJ [Thermoleophilia bacterium]|jgi:single-stranded-DNA-specific exonuclease
MGSPDDITWDIVPFSWAAADRLARELNLPLPVATILAGRGLVEPGSAQAFLDCSAPIPDPFLFADMVEAVDKLTEAIASGRRVVVHGDYDADGITATALMVLGLRSFGVEAEWYLPSRFTEGFGLSSTAVEGIAGRGPALLITVDCGINYPDQVALARHLGLDVIVIDHHQPGADLPACPLIHPVRGDYPTADLCGVGLAFKVLHALHIAILGATPQEIPEGLHALLDLVAVGTIADLVPLRGENRYYTKEGLKLLTIGSRTGFRFLSKVAGCAGRVDSGSVSFRIAPHLNAAGRLTDASLPLRLLLTEDETEAAAIADALHDMNGVRQNVERQILGETLTQIEALDILPPLLVLSGAGWHEGVVGIVASRLVERYHRPVIVLAEHDGIAKGSGRSIAHYDLMSGLDACAEWLTVFGGHKMAAGLTLDVERIDGFRQALETHAAAHLSRDDVKPVYRADAVLRSEDINADTALALASLGPFGSSNPRPRLLLLDADMRRVETTRTGAHLRCVVDVEGVKVRAIGFGLGERAEELRTDGDRRILGVQLRVDEWQGALRPELQLDRIGIGLSGRCAAPACGPQCPHWNPLSATGEVLSVAELDHGTPSDESVSTRSYGSPRSKPRLSSTRVARDIHEAGGRLSAVAQLLASGEPTLFLTCSATHRLEELAAGLPLDDLTRGGLWCVSRACAGRDVPRLGDGGTILMEWDVATRQAPVDIPTHVAALDPPYRHEHTRLLRHYADQGACVHLYYGEEQRCMTADLLRYLVHPRFALVCTYRALEKVGGDEEVRHAAAGLAWHHGRVVLGDAALSRAAYILAKLDLEQVGAGGARIKPESIPQYTEAQAEYEECSRLCRIL